MRDIMGNIGAEATDMEEDGVKTGSIAHTTGVMIQEVVIMTDIIVTTTKTCSIPAVLVKVIQKAEY